jgi:hypothetical protein
MEESFATMEQVQFGGGSNSERAAAMRAASPPGA